ncbi:hypothetical protein D3C72_2352740 [compost metagenome]
MVVARRFVIIWLMLSLSSATSPLAWMVMVRLRSPLVTAVETPAMARTWLVRFSANWLTLSVRSFHVPLTPGTFA